MKRVLLAAAVVLVLAPPATADEGASTTRDGKTLTVSKARGLRVEGEQVRVTGRGYDRSKGIYVAFCVDNGPGRVPTPCGGGADTEGSSGNSVWVSDLPPAYGTGLAKPYGEGGTFDVTIHVRAQLNDEVDCRRVRCAVVTRNDHTRSDDRSQDVVVPVTFGSAARPAPVASSAPARAGATSRPPATASAAGRPSAGASTSPTASATAAPTSTGSSDPVPSSSTGPVLRAAPASGPSVRGDGGSRVVVGLAAGLVVAGVAGAVATRGGLPVGRMRRRPS